MKKVTETKKPRRGHNPTLPKEHTNTKKNTPTTTTTNNNTNSSTS